MKDSDIILASVDNGRAVVLTSIAQATTPHIEDTMLGGTDDIEEYAEGNRTEEP